MSEHEHSDAPAVVERARRLYESGQDRRATAELQDLLDRLPATAPVRLRALYTLVCGTERWWSAGRTVGGASVDELIAEMQLLAEQSGDDLSYALTSHARGKHMIATNGLTEAVAEFSRAAAFARRSGDPGCLVDTLSEWGHHLVGRDLRAGLAVLDEALKALAAAPVDTDVTWQVRSGRLSGYVGVAYFDAEDFDSGERHLQAAVAQLDECGIVDQFAMSSNYLAQLLVAAGRFEEGNAVLRTALARTGQSTDPSMHVGYNLALLGKSELEAGRPDRAVGHLEDGWRHLSGTAHSSVRPIVRNYLAELLLHPGYRRRDPARAAELLDETITECVRSGFQRSEVLARALHAAALLELGDAPAAREQADAAAERLEQTGPMPALRGEEVHFLHYQVLSRVGTHDAATRALLAAVLILRSKAETIALPHHREAFLHRVPVSAAILSAYAALRPDDIWWR